MLIKKATPEILFAFFGKEVDNDVEALALYVKGKLLAIAGVERIENGHYVFSDYLDEVKCYPVSVVKFGHEVMKIINKYDRAFAVASENEKTSKRFLQHFGFEFQEDCAVWLS